MPGNLPFLSFKSLLLRLAPSRNMSFELPFRRPHGSSDNNNVDKIMFIVKIVKL